MIGDVDLVEDHTIEAEHGPLDVRLYRPRVVEGPGLLWLHGGAFSMNDMDVPEVDWVARRLAERGITVTSANYRLAKDGIHFPVPSDDCRAAWEWTCTAPDTGVAPGDWHIGGGSAGGNLAASVTLQVRDAPRSAPLPRSMVLAYPALHSPLPSLSADLRAATASLPDEDRFTPERMAEIDRNYAGDVALLSNPYAFPGNADLGGLPPTCIVNCEEDVLRASGQRFAAQLVEAGVDVSVTKEPGARHGHLNFPDQAAAQRTVNRISDWLLNRQGSVLG